MFAATRTPAKKQIERRKRFDADPRNSPPAANKSFEWVAGRFSPPSPQSPPTRPAATAAPCAPRHVAASSSRAVTPEAAPSREQEPRRQSIGMTIRSPQAKPMNRVAEARACLNNAKLHLNNSRNTKTEIKDAVKEALDQMFQLLKDSEAELAGKGKGKEQERIGGKTIEPEARSLSPQPAPEVGELRRMLEEHAKLIGENGDKMRDLKEHLCTHQKSIEAASYASVVAGSAARTPAQRPALHSVVITAKDETKSGEDIMEKIRIAVKAKEGGVIVEKMRKAKDRKVIVACRTEEERQKVKEKLKMVSDLNVEEMKNKDPLVILRDVLLYNSDEEVLKALRNQNKDIFEGLEKDQDRCVIAFKKRTRNPHTSHVVMRVSPGLWRRMVEAETLHVDLQRVKVADQSPLVQCSLCLGYGHGRRFCKETIEKCSHCGGPHMKARCADWLADLPPSCCNCVHAKQDRTDHNAFSGECAIRRKWDALARSAVAYC